ncbi:uncharacterized protein LOC144564287 [Carex rostrata]
MEQITVPDKDLSDKKEDNKYEPFTFELKPDLHYEPDKIEYRSFSSTSSSSDSDSDNDFIQLDTISITNSAISHKNSNPNPLLIPTLQPCFSTRPVETTNCSDVLALQDGNRIPTAIFTTQSKAPLEWSVTSAESLFSLNISNSSFTLENASFNGLPPDSPGSAISIVSDLSFVGFGGPLEALEETREGENDEVVKENNVELVTDCGKLVNVSAANLQRSDSSASSLQSFAFPVLTGDERTNTINVEPQADLPTLAISQSVSDKPKSESKSEPEPELPPSSNSDQLTQPPQPQVMATLDKEEHPTVTDTTATTNENSDTNEAVKTSTATSTSNGSFCSCCSFCS